MPSLSHRPHRHRARRGSPSRALLVVLVALTTIGSVGLGAAGQASGDAPAAGRRGSWAATPETQAAAVLRDWDRARAEAWRDGDIRALNALYADDAGARDVGLLRRYVDRGYRVHGLRTQLLSIDILRRERDAWWLRVTDRLAGGVAVRGHERVVLPRDHADTRELLLVRGDDGRWRMATARPA